MSELSASRSLTRGYHEFLLVTQSQQTKMIKSRREKAVEGETPRSVALSVQSLFHHSAPMGEDPCLSVEGEILGAGVLSSETVRL